MAKSNRKRWRVSVKLAKNGHGPAFAKVLVPLREGKGLSQEQLAARSKVSLQTIRRYERGTRDPGIIDMIHIALALEVDVMQLFDETVRKGRELA